MNIKLIAVLLALGQTLTIRESHLKKDSDEDTGDALGFIFFILIIAGIICLIIRCRRRRQESLPPPPPPLQPPIYHPNRQQPYPIYPNLQNGSNSFSPPQPFANNTYVRNYPPVMEDDITRAVNHRNSGVFWSEPDYMAEGRLRNPCGYCNSISRYGQQPRLMLDCSTRHVFHFACLNQFRVKQKMGRSMMCPSCRQSLSGQLIKLFCVVCKKRSIDLDLTKFSDNQGVIDTTAIARQYGQVCTQCKNY